MAAAMRQPHMMSQCATPRSRPRRKMNRLAANVADDAPHQRRRGCAEPVRGARNTCQPRRQYIARRRPLQPHGVAVGDAEGGEERGERVADERGVEVLQVARADDDGGRERRACHERGPRAGAHAFERLARRRAAASSSTRRRQVETHGWFAQPQARAPSLTAATNPGHTTPKRVAEDAEQQRREESAQPAQARRPDR